MTQINTSLRDEHGVVHAIEDDDVANTNFLTTCRIMYYWGATRLSNQAPTCFACIAAVKP